LNDLPDDGIRFSDEIAVARVQENGDMRADRGNSHARASKP
jgi:hypothetical protein